MSIFPLPVFEADADPDHRSAMSDEEIYARLEAPKTIVIRFGHMKHVAEYPYDGEAKPGCGSKLVARTHRGTEVVEMLTTTCSNSGCGKSVSRREMLDYIDNSGGKDYPFHVKGRILRVATIEDLNKQSALEAPRREAARFAKALVAEMQLPMKIVEAEPILGGECMTFFYMAETRVDFRDLVQRLATQFGTRIEMRQVGARDEARLVADYERCGQHCCCKNFLKVLKPVSMRQAKVQKATLDPLKISGRCGRLMCCLRYEDQTYKELKANLPHRNTRVGTSEGPGVVIDTKILVQLALIRLEHNGQEIAVPVEELLDPARCPQPAKVPDATEIREARERKREERDQRERQQRGEAAARDEKRLKPDPPPASQEHPRASPSQAMPDAPLDADDPVRGMSAEEIAKRADEGGSRRKRRRRRRRGKGGGVSPPAADLDQPRTPSEADRHRQQDAFRARSQAFDASEETADDAAPAASDAPQASGDESSGDDIGAVGQGADGGERKRRRRRRRRRRGGRGGGGNDAANTGPASP